MTTIAEIAEGLPGAIVKGDADIAVNGATHDSREVRPGYLFAVLPGDQTHGRQFVDDAIRKGAVALLVDEPMSVEIPQIIVGDTRELLGKTSAACYGDPTDKMEVVGITGTNGKTTIAYLVESALMAGGGRPGVMSTVEYRFKARLWKATHTTPEATVVQSVAREMVDAGATHLIMETSSHGLELGRLNGCCFRVVAFTNLTQDHLDFHRNMSEYGAAKLKLFTSAIDAEPRARAVVNIDDPFASEILRHLSHPVITVSVSPSSTADIRPAGNPRFSMDGIETEVRTPHDQHLLSSRLIGQHNLSNLLVGLGICVQLEMDPGLACQGLGKLKTVPGRLERVDEGEFPVLVDYAHTPNALELTLKALRPLTSGKLICVFGCGGDRDPTKRPLMGRAVGKGADLAIVTSDNPRTEDASAIVEMILPGVENVGMPKLACEQLACSSRGYTVQIDRLSAIETAIKSASPGDTVVIAGKGHEDYQILGTEKIHFDDREQALVALRALRGGGHG